jgi:hypothetical protein
MQFGIICPQFYQENRAVFEFCVSLHYGGSLLDVFVWFCLKVAASGQRSQKGLCY